MEYTILILLFYYSLQVFANAVDGTQTLDCDATVQKQHRLLLQYSQAHITTVRSAIKNINDSLQGLTQREQDVKEEADKSRELAILLQDVLSKMKNNGADGADENRIFTEKLEKEITDLKSRLLQLDFKLSALKIEDQTNKLQLKQMQTQEKELEVSISQQEQNGPIENIETYLVAQLERWHVTLELERQCCQFKLEANSIQIKNILEQINICTTEKNNLASENELNINAKDGHNRTALMHAALNNQASIAKELIDLGANLDLQDIWNYTALILAAERSHKAICKMLVEAGADVNIRTEADITALMYAAWNNNIEVVKMLLAKGAQVNLANNDGDTALHLAAEYGNVEVAKLLVHHGASTNVKANNGKTPLKRALSNNQTELADYLKSVGATE